MIDLMGETVLVGIGATLAMDIWGVVQKRAYGVAGLDYRFVGRWLGHMLHGRLWHDAIGRAAPMPGERVIGWAAHYAIGIAFAAGLVAIWGPDWLRAPTLAPALITGIGSIVFPFFILQPALGLGVAAARTQSPSVARLRSLITHTVFGVGLYVAGLLAMLIRG